MRVSNQRQHNIGFINIFSAFAYLFMLLACAPVNALEFEQAKLKNQFIETIHPEVNVSGNIIVGVMMSSAFKGLFDGELALAPAAFSSGQEVCLNVVSRDGSYTSTNNYLINTTTPNYKQLPYHSKHKKLLLKFSEDDAALSATAHSCEQSSSDYFVPVAIEKTENDARRLLPGELVVYVNGFDATDVYYEVHLDDTPVVKDCDYISKGRHTAYNFICRIDITGQKNTELPVSIHREVYGRELPSIDINVLGTR